MTNPLKTIYRFKMTNNELRNYAIKYYNSGLSIVPDDVKTKAPVIPWKEYTQTRGCNWSQNATAIGVVCGRVSGNLNVIDFDYQACMYDAWKERVYADNPDYVDLIDAAFERCVIESTQSSGIHVAYRCECAVDKNSKLCTIIAPNNGEGQVSFHGKIIKSPFEVCAIETRGEGGQVVVSPTDGYNLINGNWDDLPVFPYELHSMFIKAAQALSTVCKEPKRKSTVVSRQSFVATDFSGNDVAEFLRSDEGGAKILSNNGWSYVGEYGGDETWRRPGKDFGVSGILHKDTQMFYCFSSNAAPLEQRTYTPLELFSAFYYNGDESEASIALWKQLKHNDDIEYTIPLRIVKSESELTDVQNTDVKYRSLYDIEFPKSVLNAPGFLKMASEYVESISKRSQPVLSFASMFAMFGHLLSRRVTACKSYDVSPAQYIVAISPPSSGKGAGLLAARQILQTSESYNQAEVVTEYESVQSFFDSLESTGKQFLTQDEFGSWLRDANNANATSCKQRLLDAWLTVFSRYNDRKFTAPSSLRRKKNNSTPVCCPAFTFYGVGNLADIRQGLTGTLLKNGFVARTTFVLGDSNAVPNFDSFLESETRFIAGEEEVEDDTIDVPKAIKDYVELWYKFNRPSDLNVVKPKRIPFADSQVLREIVDFSMSINDQYLAVDELINPEYKAILGRVTEKIYKYALVFACSKYGPCDDIKIDRECVNLAIDFNKYEREVFDYLRKHEIAETEEERLGNEVIKWIMQNSVISFSMPELTRIVKSKLLRDNVKSNLISRGIIREEKVLKTDDDGKSKGRPKMLYFVDWDAVRGV